MTDSLAQRTAHQPLTRICTAAAILFATIASAAAVELSEKARAG